MRPLYDCHHESPRAGCAGLSCDRMIRAFATCARATMRAEKHFNPSRRRQDAAHRLFLRQLSATRAQLEQR
jgi:hypothetical protein